MSRPWTNEKDLAALLLARAHAGRRVILLPDTAMFVGVKLMTVAEKPSREEVARVLCNSKCERPCYLCTGIANRLVRLYGCRLR